MTDGERGVFVPEWDRHNRPGQIVTFGHVYPQGQAQAARTLVRETAAQGYTTGVSAPDVWRNVDWTRLMAALARERRWPLDRLFEILDPMLAASVALAAVPPHRAYQAFWPVRTLAQRLAHDGRVDATGCLVRHVSIRKILFGGPSTRALHRDTIQVENAERITGRRVLLLDDVAKSGMSLKACREMLLEAGALDVQAVALARVVVGR